MTAGRLSDAERVDWLRLIRCERVGPVTFHGLLDRFGSVAAALDALPELSRRGGGRAVRVPARNEAEREIDALARLGGRLVAVIEPDYPASLRAVAAPPPLLAVRGSLAPDRPGIAVVGSRNASAAGLRLAGRLARDLGEAGFLIVSGLARGIDAAAHRASLRTGTAAVVASGLDRVYPEEHAELQQSLIDAGGAVVSEMPFGWEPRAHDFPRRNRLISGLSLGVVLVEAAVRSGSLHTARFAGEQGREVFAVPGSPLDPRAAGTNLLIREGATLTRDAADVLEVLQPQLARAPDIPRALGEPVAALAGTPLDDDRRRLLSALGIAPVPIDELVRATGLPPALVQMTLLELDLAGRIERHGAQMVSLIPD